MTTPEHRLWVAFGQLADQIRVRHAFARVPVKLKAIDHSPADKPAKLLVHILAGGMHLTELRSGPHPLVAGWTAARAWGQDACASVSRVGALLGAATDQTAAVLQHELRTVVAPYQCDILSAAAAQLVSTST